MLSTQVIFAAALCFTSTALARDRQPRDHAVFNVYGVADCQGLPNYPITATAGLPNITCFETSASSLQLVSREGCSIFIYNTTTCDTVGSKELVDFDTTCYNDIAGVTINCA